jgi:hypothetical protein
VDGVRPGREFANRLGATVDRYVSIVERGGNAEFFLPGSRHHDVDSGQTDKVALHDAAGLWLVKEGIPPEVLNGKAWIDRYRPEGVYSGAEEIAVAASGFSENFRFEIVEYFCSHGQASRARTYALAHGLPARAVVIPPDTIEDEGEQFHDGSLKKRLQMFVGIVLAQTVDPYGEGALYNRTRNRIPADGNIGTIPELLDEYAVLPWYSAGAPEATL